jgi:heat shock protein HslJ
MAAAGFRPLRSVIAAFALGLCACAAPAPEPALTVAGTAWQVQSVNGRQVPAQGDYSVRFDASGNLGARFGCNAMGGHYAIAGSTLQVSDVMQTLMGCPEPAATFESQGSAILRSPMQMSPSASDRAPYEYLSLKNEAGEIILMRRTI